MVPHLSSACIIQFVSNKNNKRFFQSPLSFLLPQFNPARHIVQGATICKVKTDQNNLTITQIRWDETAETFLASGIPYLKANGDTVCSQGNKLVMWYRKANNSLSNTVWLTCFSCMYIDSNSSQIFAIAFRNIIIF